MSFRSINHTWLVPIAQGIMIFGIVSLSQPWSLFLHRYGLTITLFGLVAFMVTSKVSPVQEIDPDDLDLFDAVKVPGLSDRPNPDEKADDRGIV